MSSVGAPYPSMAIGSTLNFVVQSFCGSPTMQIRLIKSSPLVIELNSQPLSPSQGLGLGLKVPALQSHGYFLWQSAPILQTSSPHFLKIIIYLILIALGLHCCTWAFSSCSKQRLLSNCGVQASHCGGFFCCKHSLQVHGLQCSWCTDSDSVVAAHGFSCPTACGLFPDQGLDPRPLPLQADS